MNHNKGFLYLNHVYSWGVALAIILSSCQLPVGAPLPSPSPSPTLTPSPSPTPGQCTGRSKKVSWSLRPHRRHEGHVLRFGPREVEPVFADHTFAMTAAVLSLDIDEWYRRHQREIHPEIKIDINGIRTFGAILSCKRDEDLECKMDLTAVRLNGAESFGDALKRIARAHGVLVIRLHIDDPEAVTEIEHASLQIRGTVGVTCPSPTPIPSATPYPAPVTTIDSESPTGATVTTNSMAFSFSSDEGGSSFQCSLDAANSTLCSSPMNYSNLKNGAHTFKVYAVNASGVKDLSGASYTWTVAMIPPKVTITNLSTLPSLTNSTSISFSFSASSPSSYQCSLDQSAYQACTSNQTYAALAGGTHLFSVKATDAFGNVSAPAQYLWQIDLTQPVASFINITPASQATSSTSIQFTFAADKSSTFVCSLDHAAISACASPISFTGLIDGAHSFQIIATDLAGNKSTPATYTWTVDTVPPVVTLGNSVPQAGYTSASSVSVEFTANETSSFTCSLDGSAFTPCSTPFVATGLLNGNHELQVLATDLAGNVATPAVIDWVMDFTLPTLAWDQFEPSAASHINTTSLQATVTSNKSVTLSCSLNGLNLNENASPVQVSNLTEGAYQLSVSGLDLEGNTSNLLTHSFTVDLTPPEVSVTSGVGTRSGQDSNTLTFAANESATFQCSLDSAGFSLCTSPVTVSGLASGAHEFQVQATDLAGNIGAISTVDWTVDTTPPVVTSLSVLVSQTSVTVNWTTDKASTSQVSYGPGVTTGTLTASDPTLVTSHSITVTGLNAGSIYSVMAMGQDATGNAYSSAKKSFRTSP